MKYVFFICLGLLCILIAGYILVSFYRLGRILFFRHKHKNLSWAAADIGNLDHDIFVPGGLSVIEEGSMSGWDATVGPSPAGWPIATTMTWNYRLYKSVMYYYFQVDYHERVLFWTFDYPYAVCKIPKRYVGNIDTDREVRMDTLWDITYQLLHGRYELEKYFPKPKCEHINGHSVKLEGVYECTFKDYLVICNTEDSGDNW